MFVCLFVCLCVSAILINVLDYAVAGKYFTLLNLSTADQNAWSHTGSESVTKYTLIVWRPVLAVPYRFH